MTYSNFIKKSCIIPFIFIQIISFGQTLKEGVIEFPFREEGKLLFSSKISNKWIEENKANLKTSSSNGYFLFFLPPLYKKVEITKVIEIDTQLLKLEEVNGDSIEYYVYYEYIQSYWSPQIYDQKVNKSCIPGIDHMNYIALEFKEILPISQGKKIRLAKSDLENGMTTISITHDYHKIEKQPQVIVSRTFDQTLTKNLAYNNIVFLNGVYWSEFLSFSGACCRTYSSVIAMVQTALKKEGYKLLVNNQYDKKTKEAILHYQQKHKLSVGQLDEQLITKLGINLAGIKSYQYSNASINQN